MASGLRTLSNKVTGAQMYRRRRRDLVGRRGLFLVSKGAQFLTNAVDLNVGIPLVVLLVPAHASVLRRELTWWAGGPLLSSFGFESNSGLPPRTGTRVTFCR